MQLHFTVDGRVYGVGSPTLVTYSMPGPYPSGNGPVPTSSYPGPKQPCMLATMTQAIELRGPQLPNQCSATYEVVKKPMGAGQAYYRTVRELNPSQPRCYIVLEESTPVGTTAGQVPNSIRWVVKQGKGKNRQEVVLSAWCLLDSFVLSTAETAELKIGPLTNKFIKSTA